MDKEDIAAEYSTALKKIMNKKDKPCKEKYLRKIMLASLRDPKGVYFFMKMKEYTSSLDAIIKWKALLLLHIVMRNAVDSKSINPLIEQSLTFFHRKLVPGVIYSNLGEQYLFLMEERVKFMKYLPMFKNDYSLIDQREKIKIFTDPKRSNEFFKLVLKHLYTYFEFIYDVITSVETIGVNPSLLLENQNKMRVLIEILIDSEYLYKSILYGLKLYVNVPNEYINQVIDKFNNIFLKYKIVLKKASYMTYITSQYIIPSLPNESPFKNLPNPSTTPHVSTIKNPQLVKAISASNLPTVNSSKNSPKSVVDPFSRSNMKQPSQSQTTVSVNKQDSFSNTNMSPFSNLKTTTSITNSVSNQMLDLFSNDVLSLQTNNSANSPKFTKPTPIEAINAQNETKISQLQLQIKELSTALEVKESMATHLQQSSGDKINEMVKSYESKMSELTKLSSELAKKLESEKIKSRDGEDYKAKFETLTQLYSKLQASVKSDKNAPLNMNESNSDLETKFNTITKLYEDSLKQINSLKILNIEKDRKISELEEKLNQSFPINQSSNENGTGSGFTKVQLNEYLAGLQETLETDTLIKSENIDGSYKTTLLSCLSHCITKANSLIDLYGTSTDLSNVLFYLSQIHPFILKIFSAGRALADNSSDNDFINQVNDAVSAYSNLLVQIANTQDENFSITDMHETLTRSLKQLFTLSQGVDEEKGVAAGQLDVELEMKRSYQTVQTALNEIEYVLENASNDELIAKLPSGYKDSLKECKGLFELVKKLIKDTKILQDEIISEKGDIKNKVLFYKKNHKWSEGLVSTAKAVGLSAGMVGNVINELAQNKSSLEELIVTLNNMVVGTIQLTMSSQIQSDPKSQKLANVKTDTEKIKEISRNIVSMARHEIESQNKTDIEFGNLSRTRAIALENDIQIRVIDLEVRLQREREKLGKIRAAAYLEN